MPFTFSHPAVLVDLPKKYFSLSALVIGSMLPDFEYFLRLEPVRHYLHSWPGFIWFGIPMGLFVYLFFHLFLKYPLLSLFPKDHQEKLLPVCKRYRLKTSNDFLKIILSLTVGILSHIIWDSFTHDGNVVSNTIPFLQNTIAHTFLGKITVSYVLQHFSTIVGLSYITVKYFLWFKYCTVRVRIEKELLSFKKKVITLLSIITISPLLAIMYGIFRTNILHHHNRLVEFGGYTLIASISFSFIGLIVFCIRMQVDGKVFKKLQ